jgi:methyl-accepting chemotaxis protein
MRNVVETAHTVLGHYEALARDGKLAPDDARGKALAAVRALRYGTDDYFWINDMTPKMVMHPIKPALDGTDLRDYKDPNGKRLFVEFVDVVRRDRAGYVFYLWPKPGSAEPVSKISYVKGFEPWGWVIGSGVYLDDVESAFRGQALTFGLLALVIAILPAALAVVLARRTTRRVAATVAALDDVAAGDFTTEVAVDGQDEIGRIGSAVNRLARDVSETLSAVADSASKLAEASHAVATSSQGLAGGSQEQAASLEETAASLEEITATVKQNADNAHQANQLASASREVAEKGGTIVTEAVAAMGEINTSSRKIADIITTIDEIAFQTNLLALNAAVEAARAGEQGRGFAVVAAEVRNLAQRSAAAAREIKTLIQDSVGKVDAGSQLVNRSGEALHDIVSSVKRVTDIVAEIAAASGEQSSGIEQVNRAVTQMDSVVQGNAAQTEELSSTAQALAAHAAQLQALVGRFRLQASATPAAHRAPSPPPPALHRSVEAAPAAPVRTTARPVARPAAAGAPAVRARRALRASDKPLEVAEAATAAAKSGNGHSRHDDFEEF